MPAMAKYYNRFFGVEDDFQFIAKYLEKTGGPLLDLGCATVRVLNVALQKGIPAWGYDISPIMLEQARHDLLKKYPDQESNLHLCQGDYNIMELPPKTGLITSMMNSWAMTCERQKRMQGLQNVMSSLSDSGRFLVVLSVPGGPEAGFYEIDAGLDQRKKILLRVNKTEVIESEDKKFRNIKNQIFADDELIEEVTFQLGVISAEELISDAESAGFKLNGFYGDYLETPFDKNTAAWRVFDFGKV